MAKPFKFSFKGVLLLATVFLFVVLLCLTVFVYRNLKGVEQNVLNLKEQLKTANQKLQNSDKTKLDPQELFDLATKDWAKYENFDRGLKFFVLRDLESSSLLYEDSLSPPLSAPP